MSFASDRLYNTYIRRNLPTIASTVKVREVIVHLPCLTSHDRENIEAKRDNNGNHDAMVLLMECLKRRENWPEQLIQALEACEHVGLAAEVRAAYGALTGVDRSSAGSPPTTVVRAHVHPVPAASPPAVPDGGASHHAAVAPPPEVPPVPAEPAIQAPSPLQNTAEPHPPDAHLSTPTVVPPTVTPPPSPETPHALPAAAMPQEDMQRVPEENSESLDEAGDDANPQNKEEATPQSPGSRNAHPTMSPTTTRVQLGARQGSCVTPEKPPVQDSSPPATRTPAAKVFQAVQQAVDRSPHTEPAASFGTTPPLDDNDVCLSKPGQLVSVAPQSSGGPAVLPSSPDAPFSGGSDRLEISEAAPDAVAPSQVPAWSATSSSAGGSVVELPCQENGVALDLHEPEENHCESLCSSMGVLENVVHVSQEPSIPNLSGQTSCSPPQMKEAGKGVTSAADEAISDPAKAKVSPDLQTAGPPQAPQAPMTWAAPGRYALTAAAVCSCALLLAWKFKKI